MLVFRDFEEFVELTSLFNLTSLVADSVVFSQFEEVEVVCVAVRVDEECLILDSD